jgi:divalent metal cation (Fe/Co/Zn/Cd) transporter
LEKYRVDARAGLSPELVRHPRLVVDRTGQEPRELRLLHTDDGLVVFVSVVAARDIGLRDAHELASRLEDDIRDRQPHMADVVVHTEP